MKNSIKYILPICALFFASCEDFLKEEPKSFLSPDNFYPVSYTHLTLPTIGG